MVSAVVVSVSLFVNVTAQSPAPLPAVAPLNLQAPAPAPLPMASPIARVAVAEPTPLILPRPTTEPVAPAIATGSIKGEVRDEDGGTIPGAEVSARTASGVVAGSAVTNSQGRFAFSDLPVDAYQITVSLPGFRTWSARVSVVEGETTPAGVKLILGALTEVVNIKAPASMVAAPPTPPVTNFSTSPNRTRTPSDEVLPVRPEQTGPVRVGGDIRQPKNLTRVTPEYSSDAIAAGVTGTVIIEAVVNTSGAVTDVKVLSGQPLLNEVVLAAVAQWRYTPTMLNGVARPISLTAAFNFTK